MQPWVGWGLLCCALWGGAYVFLKAAAIESPNDHGADTAAGPLSPLAVHVVYASWSVVLTLVAMMVVAAVMQTLSGRSLLAEFADQWRTLSGRRVGWVTGYSLCLLGGAWLYLYASQLTDTPVALLTALSSGYPLVTMAGCWLLFRDRDGVDLRLAGPGVVLNVLGIVLLSLSQR